VNVSGNLRPHLFTAPDKAVCLLVLQIGLAINCGALYTPASARQRTNKINHDSFRRWCTQMKALSLRLVGWRDLEGEIWAMVATCGHILAIVF
jgi:hypothetical protein